MSYMSWTKANKKRLVLPLFYGNDQWVEFFNTYHSTIIYHGIDIAEFYKVNPACEINMIDLQLWIFNFHNYCTCILIFEFLNKIPLKTSGKACHLFKIMKIKRTKRTKEFQLSWFFAFTIFFLLLLFFS